MSRVIILIPTSTNVGLTSVSLGLIYAIKKNNVRIFCFDPICKKNSTNDLTDNSLMIINKYSSTILEKNLIEMNYAHRLLANNQKDILMEKIIARYEQINKNTEVILIKGFISTHEQNFTHILNYEIAKTLNAEIIFLIAPNNNSLQSFKERIKLIYSSFGGEKNRNIAGIIINKFDSPINEYGKICLNFSEFFSNHNKINITCINPKKIFIDDSTPILGCISWKFQLITPRVIDIISHLKARIINSGKMMTRRFKSVIFCSCNITNMIKNIRLSSLLIISSDRPDMFIFACLASIKNVNISAILLTGGYSIHKSIKKSCQDAFKSGLPVFIVNENDWDTSVRFQKFNLKIPINDYYRIKIAKNHIASYINMSWIKSLSSSSNRTNHVSSSMFKYKLITLASQVSKRIVLPEGDELRTIRAAIICAERGIAKCVLLGNPNKIKQIAILHSMVLNDNIDIIDPINIRENYISRLMQLRQDKGMTEIMARKQLEDNVVLGTLMLEKNEVDGLLSGAVHTTANTIRPSLQLIKMAKGNSLVSSVFFMLMPDQVLVYGDCAINTNPTAEQLSEIAIQSADSAAIFGIEPRVAMISYSTGNSAVGKDVEKIRKATHIVQKKRPNLIIDGPLQYDSAVISDVAKQKAPNSPIKGQATVLIFPDLNTGNTTYKAVQRSANILSIGPMLQGMRKPVNDLSRGALVEDIVYTIALTAIQSIQIDFLT
ncbi:Phosphate acetyltransferase [Candidatus Ecksteinia adelgidicola]|nr:Phosphate acetyltransferase [Candidatus Ecksteinia adelgidicola]